MSLARTFLLSSLLLAFGLLGAAFAGPGRTGGASDSAADEPAERARTGRLPSHSSAGGAATRAADAKDLDELVREEASAVGGEAARRLMRRMRAVHAERRRMEQLLADRRSAPEALRDQSDRVAAAESMVHRERLLIALDLPSLLSAGRAEDGRDGEPGAPPSVEADRAAEAPPVPSER